MLGAGTNKFPQSSRRLPPKTEEQNRMDTTAVPTPNEAIVLRLFAEFHNGGDERVVDEILATPQLRRQLKRSAARLGRLPVQPHFSIDDLISKGDKVVTRWTAEVLLYNQPTEANGLFIYRIRNGKVVDLWQHWDELEVIMH